MAESAVESVDPFANGGQHPASQPEPSDLSPPAAPGPAVVQYPTRSPQTISLHDLINAHPGQPVPVTPRPASTLSSSALAPTAPFELSPTDILRNPVTPSLQVVTTETGYLQGNATRTRRASIAFSDHISDDDTRNPPMAKYQRLAAIPGLSQEQVTEAAGMAQLTPRTVRVVTHAQTLVFGNIVSKLEAVVMQSVANSQDAVMSKHWDIPQKLKDRIRKFARIAMFTPMPHQWKNGRTPVIYKLLKDNKKFTKDFENYQNRIDAVNSDIGEVLSRARSTIKVKIIGTLGVPPDKAVNVYTLCEQLIDELRLKSQVIITNDVLAGIAYLRGLLEFELGNQATGREAWDILDVRLRAALEGRSDVVIRMEYLQGWLSRDQQVHGAIPTNAIVKASMGDVQQKIADAMQSFDYIDEVPVL